MLASDCMNSSSTSQRVGKGSSISGTAPRLTFSLVSFSFLEPCARINGIA